MKRCVALLLAVTMFLFTFISCDLSEPEDNEMYYYRISSVSPSEGELINLLCDDVKSFVQNYASEFDIGSSSNFYGRGDNYAMKPLTLTWSCDDSGVVDYELKIAKAPNLEDAISYVCTEPALTLEDLIPNTTYYWQVKARYADRTEQSPINSFTTERTPRTLLIEGASNSRDIGGIYCDNGKYIPYGRVYRSASLDGITAVGKATAIDLIGIRTDLDLRKVGEGTAGSGSPLGSGVNYINTPGAPYYNGTNGISRPEFWEVLADEIRVFADASNYPILVHCSVGRDRTGTLIFLIMALCGASFLDCMRDYELSFFSEAACLDGSEVSKLTDYMVNVLGYLGRMEGSTLAEKTASFFKSIGITDAEISAIIDNMTE